MTLENEALNTPETLAGGLIVRPVMFDDLEKLVILGREVTNQFIGGVGDTAEDFKNEWETPGFNLATDTRAVFTPDGKMVGYIELSDNTAPQPVHPHIFLLVHDDHYETGVGRYLLNWAWQTLPRVLDRVPAEARVVIEINAFRQDHRKRDLLAEMGYTATGQEWQRMLIRLDETEPPAPQWPEGYHIITQAEYNDLRAVYRAHITAFQDHRGALDIKILEEHFEEQFKRWQHWRASGPEVDFNWWFLAMCNGEIAGYVLCDTESWSHPERGYVGTIGVLPAHRRKGLAEALLRHGFRVMWQAGKRDIDLFVDGNSITGATRLYERVGMHVEYGNETFIKEIRPGVELSTQ